MKLQINENGCRDAEVRILDTKLPYFYAKLKEVFLYEPEEVIVNLVKSQEEFYGLKGEETEECSFVKGNIIYIYEPTQFEKATKAKRKDFYRKLCQEMMFLFYRKNKHN